MSKNGILDDARFSKIFSDPKFKKPPKHERKVKIDKRFQSMFTQDGFKVKYTVDKRGRRISKSTTEDFKRFYDLPSDEENDSISELEDSDGNSDDADTKSVNDSSDEADNEAADAESRSVSKKIKKLTKTRDKRADATDKTVPSLNKSEREIIKKNQIAPSVREKLKDMDIDYARGEGKLFSESSSDESESEESESEIYHEWNELDRDADTIDKITNRLAVCNMDWDRIRAMDLMMLFNSFLPAEGLIQSIAIYPSEFGLKRMAEEELKGPAELVTANTNDSSSGSDNDTEAEEGKQFHMERMRQYQLSRLKYYYAVATFDSPKTADIIYTNCNGVEYESSGIRLDLRFIDDDVTFDQEPKDSCDSANNVKKYEPLNFTNTALQQAKVDLTWDETDPRRQERINKITELVKTQDINDSDLEDLVSDLIAPPSSDEEDESEGTLEWTMCDTIRDSESEVPRGNTIEVFRNLLKEIEEFEKKGDTDEDCDMLEMTWGDEEPIIIKNKRKYEAATLGGDDGGDWESQKTIIKSNNGKDGDVTWGADSGEKSEKTTVISKKTRNDDATWGADSGGKSEKTTVISKNTKNDDAEFTPFQRLIEKKKEKSKMKRAMKRQKQTEKIEEAEEKSTKISKKRKKAKKNKKPAEQDEFQVDVNDERFSALYSSHLFNIDPTDSKFRKTKGMEAFVQEKQRRLSRKENSVSIPNDEPPTKKKKDAELSSLVRSLKNKTKTMFPNKLNKRK